MPQENFPSPGDLPSRPATAAPVPATPCRSSPASVRLRRAPNHTVHVTDPAFIAAGGSPFEGRTSTCCDEKLIDIARRQAVAPNFNLFTAGAPARPTSGA